MRTFLVAAVLVAGCNKPPDFSKVLGHTPDEVRAHLGNPVKSDPESEDYEFRAQGQDFTVGVLYRGGKAVLAVTLGPALPKWTEQQFRDWLGTNCTLEIESRAVDGMEPPPGVQVGFSATVRLPCTPRVY